MNFARGMPAAGGLVLVHNSYRIELRGDSMRRRKPDMPGDEKN
jgi:hypothetical protein